ncbi:MAG: nitroreductase family protein [Armatimonadota bacterium]
MDVFEAIRTRRSVRRFKPDPVPEEDLRVIIGHAGCAPSAHNAQMWKFYAVTNRELLSEMKEAILARLDALLALPESEEFRGRLQSARIYSTFFAESPVTIAVFREPYAGPVDLILERRGASREEIDALRQRPDVQSVGAAVENLCLAAHAMGYGACWMTSPCIASREIERLMDVQPPWELAALLPIGIPDEEPTERPRKPLEEILEFIR